MFKRYYLMLLFLTTAYLSSGCQSPATHDTIVQLSARSIVEKGELAGVTSLAGLLELGNHGIAYPDDMNGVLVVHNGRPYRVGVDGNVRDPELFRNVPLGTVCSFFMDTALALPARTDMSKLKKLIDESVPDKNMFCAIQVSGRFHRINAYVNAMDQALVDIRTKGWKPGVHRFALEKVSGTLVGYRLPVLTAGSEKPGYQFVFISDNLMSGGVVEDFSLADGTAEVDVCHEYHLKLPSPDGPTVKLPHNP